MVERGENGQQKSENSSALINLTGKFFPEKRGVLAQLGHFLEKGGEERAFWTPERKKLAKRIVEAANQQLEPFGVPKISFRQNQVRLVSKKEAISARGEAYSDSLKGYIYLCPELLTSDDHFALNYCHELLHTLSLRLLKSHTKGSFEIRSGLTMTKYLPAKENQQFFVFLNEAVIMLTSHQILNPLLLKALPPQGYQFYRNIFKALTDEIIARNPKYHSFQEIFPVFQKAVFGKGRALEAMRAIEGAYGKGSLRHLDKLVSRVPYKKEVTPDGILLEIDFTPPHYDKLKEFLYTPVAQREFLEACKKPEEQVLECDLAGEKIIADLSAVSSGIPFVDFKDYRGEIREGLINQIREYFDSLSFSIARGEYNSPSYFKGQILAMLRNKDNFFFPTVLSLSGNYEKPGGRSGQFYKTPPQPTAPIWDSATDEVIKNLVFSALEKESQPVVVINEKGIELKFYKTKSLTGLPIDIYCVEGTNQESGLTAYSLALASKGADPHTWWQKK